jgi:hypothetical protein
MVRIQNKPGSLFQFLPKEEYQVGSKIKDPNIKGEDAAGGKDKGSREGFEVCKFRTKFKGNV